MCGLPFFDKCLLRHLEAGEMHLVGSRIYLETPCKEAVSLLLQMVARTARNIKEILVEGCIMPVK